MDNTYCVKVIARKQVIAQANGLSKEEAKTRKKELQALIERYQIKAKVKREVE